MISIWEEELDERELNLLKKDKSCQILIIGANLSGLFAAYFCRQKGLDVIVVEEGTLEERALEINFFEQVKDIKSWTYSIWYPYICMKNRMKCQMARVPAYYYWLDQKPTAHMPKQPVFHPVKWVRAMAAMVKTYEMVKIQDLQEHRLVTEAEYIHFDHVIDTRKQESKEEETWIALTNVNLEAGIYLCMDGEAHFLVWNEKVIMRSSYQFLFPGAKIENEWKVNCGRKEGIYESMGWARKYVREISF